MRITSQRESCKGCPFHGAKVGTRGPEDSPFMIIGESPGKDEVKNGVPFVGMSWRVLQDAIQKSGIPCDYEPYITNAIHCWPGPNDKSQTTLAQATTLCHHHLVDEINKYPRKLVLTLGAPALWSVTNNTNLRITKTRGRFITDQLSKDIKNVEHAFATIHPAFILRGGGNYRQFRGDVRYALDVLNGGSIKRHPDVRYTVLDNPFKLRQALEELKQLPDTYIAGDIETGSSPDDPLGPGGFNHIDDSILSIGFAYHNDHVFIIPEELVDHIYTRRIFQLQHLKWIWQNGKFDTKFLWSFNIPEARVDEDIMLMSYVLDERGQRIHDLETISCDWLDAPNWKGVLDSHKKKGQSYRVIPRDILYKYQAYDVSNTLRLYYVLRPIINSDANDRKLYERTLLPGSNYLAHVEDRGICIDITTVKENDKRLQALCEEYAEPIFEAALNFPNSGYTEKLPNSPKQLSRLLYEDLKIPSKDKGTGDDVLENLPDHPVVNALRKYRKVAKQRGTYVVPLYEAKASDGKVHTTFKLHATATGRLASSDPMNMQNIPRDDKIRGQWVPSKGNLFIEPDLNQAELRSLAALSRDPLLCKTYTDPTSKGIHDIVRSEMFGDPENWSQKDMDQFAYKFFIHEPDEAKRIKFILDEQKMKAKNVNFGIVYGITEYGLAEQLGGTHSEARDALAAWRRKFPVAWDFISQCMRAPRAGQNLVTPFGNRKRHHVVTPENVDALEKEAANFPHQAIASHIMLHGGIEVFERYAKEFDAYIVNTVHDSMLIEAPDDYDTIVALCEDVTKVLEQVPVKWGIDHIPFLAEAKLGPRWGRGYMTDYKKWLTIQQVKKDQLRELQQIAAL